MKIQQFLDHHGIAANPFAEEDAQTDPVFKEHCIASMYHPAWDKIYGNPAEPATSVVFGEKGSGKTALRLQIARHLAEYNRSHPKQRIFVIEYDDFNPFLDRFQDRFGARRRRLDRLLAEWKLWDHMDAILSLGVTRLDDEILSGRERLADADWQLDRHQVRDLLLLAACYDRSLADTRKGRWHKLRRKLRFQTWWANWDLVLGISVTLIVAALVIGLGKWEWLTHWLPYILILAGWAPRLWRTWKWFWQAAGIVRRVRVGNLHLNSLRQILMNFTGPEIAGQPLPNKQRTDDRYELLVKFQGILRALGYTGIIVLVDRVDEPHLITGSAEGMRALLWPMLDNKFLKHPGMGFKLLLPIELSRFVEREQQDFFQRSRLDKQNMIPSLEWTGEALYDLATARVQACAVGVPPLGGSGTALPSRSTAQENRPTVAGARTGSKPTFGDLFEDSISQQRLIEALRSLRVPRHLFKFMYRLLVAHCNAYTDDNPSWQISSEMFESQLAVYRHEQDAFDRGVGVV